MMMMALARDAGILPAQLLPATLSSAELEAAKLARWLELQPPLEPTPQYLLWQTEDIIDWLLNLWETDVELQKDISEEDFRAFIQDLYAYREELLAELSQTAETAP